MFVIVFASLHIDTSLLILDHRVHLRTYLIRTLFLITSSLCASYPKQGVKVYHLQDRKFKRPIAELRMQIACAGANQSPFVRACSDLFVKLVADALVETCYQATTCELGSSIFCSDIGYTVRVHGFDHKLLSLAQHILAVFFSFRKDSETLPDIIEEGRFDACLEILLRNYHNSGMQASRFCTDIRLQSIRPTIWSCSAKVRCVEGGTDCSMSLSDREQYFH